MAHVDHHDFSWDRVFRAVEKVKERLDRVTATLEASRIPYAVVGGNAVAAWVTRWDEGGVRATPNVDILIQRGEILRVRSLLDTAGFLHHPGFAIDTFLDNREANPRDSVHVLIAGEKVRPDNSEALPDLGTPVRHDSYQILGIEPLVRMKLVAYRRIDRVHLRDMLDIGLIDAGLAWPVPAGIERAAASADR